MGDASRSAVRSVQSLWRYPVKSMLGEEVENTSLTERGLQGDRTYAVVDETTGKVGSAKNPREWGSLLGFKAAFVDGRRRSGGAHYFSGRRGDQQPAERY